MIEIWWHFRAWKMKYFLPHKVLSTFLAHAVNNFSRTDSKHVETLAFVIGRRNGNEVTATDIMFPQQEGTPSHVDDTGSTKYYFQKFCFWQFILHVDNYEKSGAKWIFDKTYEKDPVLVTWIHSHVRGVPCCFSSIDMHTQYAYERVHPGIFGTVFQINEQNGCVKYDFYKLTEKGKHVKF